MLPQRTKPFVCYSRRVHLLILLPTEQHINISIISFVKRELSRLPVYVRKRLGCDPDYSSASGKFPCHATNWKRTISGGQSLQTHRTKTSLPLSVLSGAPAEWYCAVVVPLLRLLARTSYLNTYFNFFSAQVRIIVTSYFLRGTSYDEAPKSGH